MKLIGSDAVLTEIAKLIMLEDVDALECASSKEFDINREFQITALIKDLPITLALSERKVCVIDWLLTKGVDLNNPYNPAILTACSCADGKMIKLLIEKGANVNAKHRIGKSAMSAALHDNNHDAIQILLESGYEIHRDGSSLRQAVSNKQHHAIKLFLDHGIDVNYCEPDMVFPYNSTPVHIAAKMNDLKIVQILVEHNADVTIKDKHGERPYNCAVENGNEEMKALLKSLEPARWHDEEQKLIEFKNYKLPEVLLRVLRSENRRFEIPDNVYVKHFVFGSLTDVKPVSWKKYKFLDLLTDVDNYDNQGFLVWYPKKKCFAFADYEHEELKIICGAEEFFDNPSKQLDKVFSSDAAIDNCKIIAKPI